MLPTTLNFAEIDYNFVKSFITSYHKSQNVSSNPFLNYFMCHHSFILNASGEMMWAFFSEPFAHDENNLKKPFMKNKMLYTN